MEERKAVFGEEHKIVDNVPEGEGGDESSSDGSAGKSAKQLSNSVVGFFPVTEEAIHAVPEITEFENAELNQAVHTGCVDVLKAVKDAPPGAEAIIAISLDAKQKTDVLIGEPGAGVVPFVKMDAPYMIIHNHAGGETFSLKDVDQFASDPNCKGLAVVGNNGKVFLLSKTTAYNGEGFSAYYFSHLYGIVPSESNEQFLKGGMKYGVLYAERATDRRTD